jgi:hypothetical protein
MFYLTVKIDNIEGAYNKKTQKYGYKDASTGKIFIDCKFDELFDYIKFEQGLTGVEMDNKWGFINLRGDLVIPCIYRDVSRFCAKEGLATVATGEGGRSEWKYGMIDPTGKIVIPIEYDWIDDRFVPNAPDYEHTGLIQVKLNEKHGFIDASGNAVIPIIYDKFISNFRDGTTTVTLDGNEFRINLKGEKVSE